RSGSSCRSLRSACKLANRSRRQPPGCPRYAGPLRIAFQIRQFNAYELAHALLDRSEALTHELHLGRLRGVERRKRAAPHVADGTSEATLQRRLSGFLGRPRPWLPVRRVLRVAQL